MTSVKRSVLLEYSAEQMYALVERVEDYPQFLPWCSDVDVQRDAGTSEVLAKLSLNFHGFRQSFTTRNQNVQPESITMALVSGPFRKLNGRWTFKHLRADACRVELDLEYDLSGHLLEQMIDQVFGAIANSYVDSFCQRAKT
ncbi:MAG: type II toxin-antitoxin system RatA family toxin, partial [Burkholderiaceae bacterium]|nr:type II toxin-antitoxin system RatA family toxin [Burkholderiaceae bacterium]